MRGYFFGQVERASIAEKIQFITKHLKEHSLKLLLWGTELAKSTYYDFINRKSSEQYERIKKRRGLVEEIFREYDGIYGARKIKSILEKKHIRVSVRTVSNDMKALGLASCYVKKYRPKQTSACDGIFLNHLKSLKTTRPLEHIVTDITYLHTIKDGWIYLLTFMDKHTRKVLHFDMNKQMTSLFVNRGVCKLLQKHPSITLIHSDRGSQFTASSYQIILENNCVTASYSAKGYPYDNAIIESYHAALKIEKIYRSKLYNLKDAFKAVFTYNYGFYNTRRIHQSLEYLTPNQFEKIAIAA